MEHTLGGGGRPCALAPDRRWAYGWAAAWTLNCRAGDLRGAVVPY